MSGAQLINIEPSELIFEFTGEGPRLECVKFDNSEHKEVFPTMSVILPKIVVVVFSSTTSAEPEFKKSAMGV